MVKLGANAVKLEGCNDYMIELIKRTTQMGVPVMGHIGFTPQSQNVIGGHLIQGKTEEDSLRFGLVWHAVPWVVFTPVTMATI